METANHSPAKEDVAMLITQVWILKHIYYEEAQLWALFEPQS